MTELSLDLAPRYFFHAYHLAETLKLKEVDRLFDKAAKTQSASKLVYQDAEDRYFFIYRFGSIVFFNVEPERQRSIIERINSIASARSGPSGPRSSSATLRRYSSSRRGCGRTWKSGGDAASHSGASTSRSACSAFIRSFVDGS